MERLGGRAASQSRGSKPKLLKKLLVVLAPLVLIAGWFALRGKQPPEVPFAAVARGTLVSTLTTNGRIEPLEWVVVRSQGSGPVGQIHVRRGRTVQQGQILVTLDAGDLPAQLAAAQSRIAQAKAELETLSRGGRASELAEIESGLVRARAELATAQREFEIARRLSEKHAIPLAEVTSARDAVQKAELQIQSLERRRASLVTPPDKAAARARLEEAEKAAATATARLAATQVRSPLAGVLYSFDLKQGSFLNPGDEVGRVGKLAELRVVLYVDEPELGRVQKGMPVTITWDALPGRQWTGTVESVPLQVVALGTRQVGEVPCTIANPDLSLIPGTNINAEIRSRVVDNALTIPKEALRREGTQSGVLKLDGDRVVWQQVKLGAASLTHVQVLEGLAEGDRVALPTDTPLRPGSAVRVARQR